MFKQFLIVAFGALFFVQVCKSDAVDDAEAALNVLRQTTSDNLNGGFLEHIKMSMEVDTVALDTKDAGMKAIQDLKCKSKLKNLKKKLASDEVIACVNDQADEAVTLIFTKSSGLTDMTLKTIYDLEKKIIICGREDTDCLTGVIDEIEQSTADVPNVVFDEVEVDRQQVEEQIALIQACASQAKLIVKNC